MRSILHLSFQSLFPTRTFPNVFNPVLCLCFPRGIGWSSSCKEGVEDSRREYGGGGLIFQGAVWMSFPVLFLLTVVCVEGDQCYCGHTAQAEGTRLAPGLSAVPQVDALAMVGVGAGQQLQGLTGLVCLQADGTLRVVESPPDLAGGDPWMLSFSLVLVPPPASVPFCASCKNMDAC